MIWVFRYLGDQDTLSKIFVKFEYMFKTNLFFLAKTPNLDQVQQQLEKDLAPIWLRKCSTGAAERYLPTQAIIIICRGKH